MRAIICSVSLFTMNQKVDVIENGNIESFYTTIEEIPELAISLANDKNINEIKIYNNPYAEDIMNSIYSLQENNYSYIDINVEIIE